MNLNQLLYFSVTARHQHFTRAAEELFISQPSLSYAISSLEDELGVSLFEKKGRNVVLTHQGAMFLTHVERALSEIQQGRESLQRMNTDAENLIEIAVASTAIGKHSLPDLLNEFSHDPQNADVRFHFTQTTDAEMISGLKSMRYDIAFLSEAAEATDITTILLPARMLYAIVPEDHPLAAFESISLHSLSPYPLIINENAPASRILLQLMPDLRVSSRVCDRSDLLNLAAAGFGVAISHLPREVAPYHLRAIPIDADCHSQPCIAYKKNRYISPTMERFLKYIENRISQ